MLLAVALVGELQQQAGLAHARVADDDVLEQERVRHVIIITILRY